ncbi:hypothetical protein B7463_g12317, partial [Scytalidium lignicola]
MVYNSDIAIDVPLNTTLWSWCFESPDTRVTSGLSKRGGFRDADTGNFKSFQQLAELSIYASVGLFEQLELRAGDTVTIFAENSLLWIVALFSSLRIGVVISAASSALTSEELANSLRNTSSKCIFTSAKNLRTTLAAITWAGIPKSNVILLSESPQIGFTILQDLIDKGRKLPARHRVPPYTFPPGKKANGVVAVLGSSSGTTGLPKSVCISHANLIAQCYQVLHVTAPEMRSGRTLAVLPFAHIAGLSQQIIIPFILNQEVVVMDKFHMKNMLHAIQSYQINEVWLVPPIMIRLANDPVATEFDLSCLKQVIYGAAPISLETLSALRKRFPHIRMRNSWGMTEATGCSATMPWELQTWENAHLVGKPMANMQMKIVDPSTGNEVQEGECGEILFRGPNVTLGYLNNDQATAESYDKDHWLHSGDLGRITNAGLLEIVDRIKEMIKVKGIQVAPAELEGLLLGHAMVVDAAVIGIPHPYSGEVPKAFLVLKDDSKKNEARQELVDFVKSKVARFKWLDGGVEFVNEIPRSASGKILEPVLEHGIRDAEILPETPDGIWPVDGLDDLDWLNSIDWTRGPFGDPDWLNSTD